MCRLGDRVLLDGCIATVRFAGALTGRDGVWVGLEWDDSTRGRNDGSFEGKRYFDCVASGSCASFLRLDSFQQKSAAGCSLCDALKERYSQQDDYAVQEGCTNRTILTANETSLQVQLLQHVHVQRRQADLDHLDSASLIAAQIATVDGVSSIAPNLRELDLSGNLLSSFEDVYRLLHELPHLRLLNISCNRLQFSSGADAVQHLQILVVNSANASWNDVVSSCQNFGGLKELHVCSNGISTLAASISQQLPKSLETISLQNNRIASWIDVLTLSHLPRLSQLLLSQNLITHISSLEPGSKKSLFSALKTLTLGSNQLNSWQSISALNDHQQLRELRVSGNPVIVAGGPGSRHEVVGRIGRLTKLNGCMITAAERQDAEIRYLRKATGQLGKEHDTTGDLKREESGTYHEAARIKELQNKYGDIGHAAQNASGPTSMGSSMLELVLHCVAHSAGRALPPQHKKVPGSMTIGKLKHMINCLFKLPIDEQVLLVKGKTDPLPLPLEGSNSLNLFHFDIQSGSAIFIEDHMCR